MQGAGNTHRPEHAGGALGPEGDGAALAAIREGIHLLANHVRLGSDRPAEQLCLLDHRSRDLVEPVAGRPGRCHVKDPSEVAVGAWQRVAHPPDQLRAAVYENSGTQMVADANTL